MRHLLLTLALIVLAAAPAAADVLMPGERSVEHVLRLEPGAGLEGVTLVLAPVRGFHGVQVLAPGGESRFSSKYGTRVYALRADQAVPEDVEALARAAFASGDLPVSEVRSVGLADPTTRIVTRVRLDSIDGDVVRLAQLDQREVGAAGSTGRGESVIQISGAHTVVEFMRTGQSPRDACLGALDRLVRATRVPYLLDDQGRPNFNVQFYAVNKAGEAAGAAIWKGSTYTVCRAGEEARKLPCDSLYPTKPPWRTDRD